MALGTYSVPKRPCGQVPSVYSLWNSGRDSAETLAYNFNIFYTYGLFVNGDICVSRTLNSACELC